MKTKEELEEVIKDTIKKFKEIIFGSDTPACMVCLEQLRKHQIIWSKADGRYSEETCMGGILERQILN